MSTQDEELKKAQQHNFTVSYDNEASPRVMFISVPIGRLADEMEEGSYILRGGMEEMTMLTLQTMRGLRMKKAATNGIIKPRVVQ